MAKISNQPMLKIEGIPLTFKDTFNKVLSNFKDTTTRVFNLLETVILSCVLVEAIIKAELKKINPTLILNKLDAETIALVSGKEEKLLEKPNYEISDIRTASITELIERLAKFEDLSKHRTGLQNFFKLRNKIVHSADKVHLQENEISILLTKHIFPFIKEYVDVEESTWQDIQKIAYVAHNTFRRYLVKIIVEHRRKAEKLSKEEVKKLIKSNPKIHLEREEYPRGDYLTCPGCHNPSVSVVDGVDVEFDGEGLMHHGYTFAFCRVCELRLENTELEEIIQNPKYYFSPTDEQLAEWRQILKEPDYSAVDYSGDDD